MIAEDRKVELVFEMGQLFEHDMSPDDAFKRVADRAYISGADRRNLREDWKESPWFKKWAKENPGEVKNLDW